jgi:hypothetical protein
VVAVGVVVSTAVVVDVSNVVCWTVVGEGGAEVSTAASMTSVSMAAGLPAMKVPASAPTTATAVGMGHVLRMLALTVAAPDRRFSEAIRL